MTNHCGTCKHWAKGAQDNPDRGNCQVIEHQDGGDPSALALLNETSGIASAWLETRAEFGCRPATVENGPSQTKEVTHD